MNANEKYKVIKLVHENRKSKKRASVELGMSVRQINRLLKKYQEEGKAAFIHGNSGNQPPHSVPSEVKKEIIALYKSYSVTPNVTHFTEHLKEHHQIVYSDTTIRSILSGALLLSPKAQRKTRRRMKQLIKDASKKKTEEIDSIPQLTQQEFPEKAHPSRPRKKYRGELIQMDASSFQWFGNEITHLHLAIDDASGNIVGGFLDTQETLNAYYQVLHQCLTKRGIPATILTDNRTVFAYKSQQRKLIEEDKFTQFGFACHQLGIELKTTSIPQGKGRVERLNQTVQSRLAFDMSFAQIQTIEEANQFLKEWIVKYNKRFGNKASESVFEKAPTPSTLNILLARVATRIFDSGHHIRFNNHHYLPVENGKDLYFTRKSEALVIQGLDGNIYINVDNKIYSSRMLLEHELVSNEFDEAPKTKKERRQYIPPQSHPWKLASFIKYLYRIGKTLDEYEAERIA